VSTEHATEHIASAPTAPGHAPGRAAPGGVLPGERIARRFDRPTTFEPISAPVAVATVSIDEPANGASPALASSAPDQTITADHVLLADASATVDHIDRLDRADPIADNADGAVAFVPVAPGPVPGGDPRSAPPTGPRTSSCTTAQLRRFIKSRAYLPMHELRRRFAIDGPEDDVSGIDLRGSWVFVGLPGGESSMLGELLRNGEVGFELSHDPVAPIIVGVFPMRPIPRP
jgi:hypothetical protein